MSTSRRLTEGYALIGMSFLIHGAAEPNGHARPSNTSPRRDIDRLFVESTVSSPARRASSTGTAWEASGLNYVLRRRDAPPVRSSHSRPAHTAMNCKRGRGDTGEGAQFRILPSAGLPSGLDARAIPHGTRVVNRPQDPGA